MPESAEKYLDSIRLNGVSEKVIQDYVRLYMQNGLGPDTRISFSQLTSLFYENQFPNKQAKKEPVYSSKEWLVFLISSYDGKPKKFDFLNNLLRIGWKKKDLEDLVSEELPPYKSLRNPLGEYLKEISKYPLLTREQEIELSKMARRGDLDARQKMINSNLKLVVSIARSYSKNQDIYDLIEEGNLGLIKAVEKFDPERGYKFSTYATWWIKQRIRKFLINSRRNIRLPSYLAQRVSDFERFEREYLSQYGFPPSLEEICRETGLKQEAVKEIIKISKLGRQLDLFKEEEKTSFFQKQSLSPPRELTKTETQKLIRQVYRSALTQKEQDILRFHLGLWGSKPLTLNEIGKRFGITREAVRQIEKKSLGKLRRIFLSQLSKNVLEELFDS